MTTRPLISASLPDQLQCQQISRQVSDVTFPTNPISQAVSSRLSSPTKALKFPTLSIEQIAPVKTETPHPLQNSPQDPLQPKKIAGDVKTALTLQNLQKITTLLASTQQELEQAHIANQGLNSFEADMRSVLEGMHKFVQKNVATIRSLTAELNLQVNDRGDILSLTGEPITIRANLVHPTLSNERLTLQEMAAKLLTLKQEQKLPEGIQHIMLEYLAKLLERKLSETTTCTIDSILEFPNANSNTDLVETYSIKNRRILTLTNDIEKFLSSVNLENLENATINLKQSHIKLQILHARQQSTVELERKISQIDSVIGQQLVIIRILCLLLNYDAKKYECVDYLTSK